MGGAVFLLDKVPKVLCMIDGGCVVRELFHECSTNLEEVRVMKKRKVVKKTRTRVKKANHGSTLIYGLEQEFVLIVGGGFTVVVLGMFLIFR